MLTIQKILLIRKLPLFKEMGPEALLGIAQIASEKVFKSGECVFQKGEVGSSLFLIVEGMVRIHDHQNIKNSDTSLAKLEEGEFFGELSILGNEKRTASATAEDNCKLLEIGKDSFQRLMIENFEISQNLLSALADRIRELTAQIQKNTT